MNRNANYDAFSNVEFLRGRILQRDQESGNAGVDEQARILALQNAGVECPHCGSESGHKIHCLLISPATAQRRIDEVAELNRIASL